MKFIEKILFFLVALLPSNPSFAGKKYRLPVIAAGVSELIGYRIRDIYVLALDAQDQWQHIPFQIDELNSRDEFVLAQGLPFTKNSDDGIYDGNDELVLSTADIGGCFAKGELKKIAIKTAMWRVEVKLGKEILGCVLVGSGETPVPRGKPFLPRAHFLRSKERVESANYAYQFHENKSVLLGKVSLPSGGELQPLVTSSQFKLVLNLPWYLPNFYLTDENFVSTIESWQEGPIRTIVAVGVKLNKFLSLLNLHMFSELVFYENAFQIPTVLEFSFDPDRYFRPGTGVAYTIGWNEKMVKRFHTNFARLPPEGPGELYERGLRAESLGAVQASLESADQTFTIRTRVDPRLLKESLPPFYVQASDFSDDKKARTWRWLKGMQGNWGVFIDLSGLRKGSFDFGLDLFLDSEAHESIIADFDNIKTNWSAISSR